MKGFKLVCVSLLNEPFNAFWHSNRLFEIKKYNWLGILKLLCGVLTTESLKFKLTSKYIMDITKSSCQQFTIL